MTAIKRALAKIFSVLLLILSRFGNGIFVFLWIFYGLQDYDKNPIESMKIIVWGMAFGILFVLADLDKTRDEIRALHKEITLLRYDKELMTRNDKRL